MDSQEFSKKAIVVGVLALFVGGIAGYFYGVSQGKIAGIGEGMEQKPQKRRRKRQ